MNAHDFAHLLEGLAAEVRLGNLNAINITWKVGQQPHTSVGLVKPAEFVMVPITILEPPT
jgi:hypothetical protein